MAPGPFTEAARALACAGDANVFLLHANADPDCVGAAVALARTFGGILHAPAGVAASGRRLERHVSAGILDGAPASLEGLHPVVVDTGTSVQLGDAWPMLTAAPGIPFAVVDHHAPGDIVAAATNVALDPARSSACEVALAVIEADGRTPDTTAAFALLAGVVADTAHFRFANAATFRDAARLMPLAGVQSIEDVTPILEDEDADGSDERSRRIAQLKAARRMELFTMGRHVVATSDVRSHESAAALALTRMGADVALVAAKRADGTRVSARARRGIVDQDGLHLGHVLRAVAETHGCGGGGHAASAGMSGAPDADVILPAIGIALRDALGERKIGKA